MPWLLVGAACAFGLTVFVPPLAALIGLGLAAVAWVRRRADGYAMFTIGFAIWLTVYIALAVFFLLTGGDSSGSTTASSTGGCKSAQHRRCGLSASRGACGAWC